MYDSGSSGISEISFDIKPYKNIEMIRPAYVLRPMGIILS